MDIKEFVSKNYGEYKIKNNNIIVKVCPFCKGISNKSNQAEKDNLYTFGISLETGQYNCFRGSCGARGHINQLAKQKIKKVIFTPESNVSFNEAKFTAEIPKCITIDTAQKTIDWAKSRHIEEKTLQKYSCRAVKENQDLVIPVYQEGILVNFKIRDITGKKTIKSKHSANGKNFLIGAQLCNFEIKELIIVEGEIDMLTLNQVGFENVVSVPNGANDSWVNDCLWFLEKFDTIILWLDNDLAGENATKKIVDRLNKKTFIVKGRQKDANEYFFKYTKDEAIKYLKEDFENKIEPSISGVTELTSFERIDITKIKTYRTGFAGLDKYLKGWRVGELTIWTGKRQSGKSTMIGQCILQLVEENEKIFVYTGELSKNHFREWLYLQANGEEKLKKIFNEISNDNDYIVENKVFDKISNWIKNKVYLYDKEDVAKETELINIIKKIRIKKDCRVFVIDNLTTVKLDSLSDNFYRQQSEFISNLKAICRNYDTHIHLVVHPKKVEDGAKEVKVSDIGGSGDISNLADNVIIIERLEDGNNNSKVSIGKNRMFGINKSFLLDFNSENKRFYSPESKVEKFKKYGWVNEKHECFEGEVVECEVPEMFEGML